MNRPRRYSRHITRGTRWGALRLYALRRDGFRCVQCGARDQLEVDHIEPVRTHPERAWLLENLQCLCPACHTRKTRLEIGHDPQNKDRADWQKAVAQLAKQPVKR